MISPHELRIGNYLFHKENPIQVLGIDITLNQQYEISFADCLVIKSQELKRFYPIPLDRGMLSRLGFNALHITEQRTIINGMDSLFELSPDADNAGYEIIWDGAFTGRKISALHELQNHFYYFTGIELKKP